jgi:hypothetical protein
MSLPPCFTHAHTQIHYGNMSARMHTAQVEYLRGAKARDQRSPNGFLYGFIQMDGVLAARTLCANSIYSIAVSATVYI